jgi:hypothetical protein
MNSPTTAPTSPKPTLIRNHRFEEDLMFVRAHRDQQRLQVDVGILCRLIGGDQRDDGGERY